MRPAWPQLSATHADTCLLCYYVPMSGCSQHCGWPDCPSRFRNPACTLASSSWPDGLAQWLLLLLGLPRISTPQSHSLPSATRDASHEAGAGLTGPCSHTIHSRYTLARPVLHDNCTRIVYLLPHGHSCVAPVKQRFLEELGHRRLAHSAARAALGTLVRGRRCQPAAQNRRLAPSQLVLHQASLREQSPTTRASHYELVRELGQAIVPYCRPRGGDY